MNQTAIDQFLKTEEFKTFIAHVDRWGAEHSRNSWGNRMAWVALASGIKVAKRYAQRRTLYQESPAWAAYNHLLDFGIFSEDPEGLVYEPEHDKWGDDLNPHAWMEVIVDAADGQEPPADFPRLQ